MTRTILLLAEKLFIVMMAASLFLRLLPQVKFDPIILAYLANEFASAILILLQRRGVLATSAYPVAIAFLGTAFALSVSVTGKLIAPQWVADGFVVLGLGLALLAKLSLRRSFGLIAANRGVRIGGPYRFVRHPMYSGYMLSHIGFLLAHFSLWNCGVYVVTWTFLWLRIDAEEKVLGDDAAYQDYRSRVSARLIPALL